MSVPVDLVDPTQLKDPVEEFFRQGGIDVQADENNSMSQAKKVALIGTALAASFIVYRTLMHKELDEVEPPSTKGAAVKLLSMAWGRTAAPWQRAALPAAIRAYQLGQTSQISEVELETLASHYVASLGEYMHTTSAQALADGFQAQLNKGWSKEVAWVRSVYGYGLDDAQTRQYLKSFAEGAKSGYVADPIPAASRKVVDLALASRAKRFGDTEAWSAVETGKNVVWLYKITTGELPKGMKKRWVTARDELVCPVCGPLDDATILVERRFHTSDGKKVYAPGIHPNCRCRLELVYPQNRVDELVRKNRPGDPYDRDKDGQFARKESRGWTYQQAMDDHEKKRPTLTRVRERVLESTEPATTTTTNPFSEPARNPFGVTTSPFSRAKASPFTSASPFAAAAPAHAAAPAVRRQVVHVISPSGESDIDLPIGDDGKVDPPESIDSLVFSHARAIEYGLNFYRSNGDLINLSSNDYRPQMGDRLDLTGSKDAQTGDFYSPYGLYSSLFDQAQWNEAAQEERERFGANARDDGIRFKGDASIGGKVKIIYVIDEAMGYHSDDEDTVMPSGQYLVTDIDDDGEVTDFESDELGVTESYVVYLKYFHP